MRFPNPIQNLTTLLIALLLAGAAMFSGCNADSAKAAHIGRGENYLNERRFQEAALEFRSAIEIDKTFAAAYYGLARAYEGQNRFAETVEELRKTIRFDAKHIDGRLKLANYLLAPPSPNTAEAEKLAAEILALDANHIEAHVLRATIAALAKKPDAEVVTILDKAIALNPARVETYLSKARFFMSRENTAEAESTFQRALQVNENSVLAHLDYGRFLDAVKRSAEAEKHFRRAVEIEPANRAALETLGEFYVARNNFAQAEEIYRSLANLNPNRPEEKLVLADFYTAIDREADAIKIYEEVVAQKPDFIRGRARLGEFYLQRGDVSGANNQATDILKYNGRDAAGLLLRARVRLRGGDAETAVRDLQEVLKQEPTSRLALYFMADAQLRIGKIEQARNFVGDLERFHPNYLFSQQLKTQISFAEGLPEKAREEADYLLKKLSENNSPPSRSEAAELRLGALTARGSAHLQLNKINEAKSDFEAARQLAPNSPLVYLNLAKVAAKTKNYGEAASFYAKALEIDNQNFDALSGLVNVKIAAKQFGEAVALIDRQSTGADSPANLQAARLLLKSQVYSAERKFAEAENALTEAIRIDGGYVPAYLSYAALLSGQNKIDAAIAKYREILTRNPKDANVYALIGLLEDERGGVDAAIENYKKSLQLNPNTVIAANNLAWNYAAHGRGNLDEAVSLIQPLTEKYPNEAGYADTLGWVYHKKGAHELSLAQFRRAIILDEKAAANSGQAIFPAYRVRLGTVLAAAGDANGARREVQTALQNQKNMTAGEIEQARNLLDSLNSKS